MVRLRSSTTGVLIGTEVIEEEKEEGRLEKKESLLRTGVLTYNKRNTSLSQADPNTESSQPQQATVASI
jgi:hypothetical protein